MAKAKKTAKDKLRTLRTTLLTIAAYPPEGHDRRDDDGYPVEFTYDEFAYRRIVDVFRDAVTKAVDDSLKN